MWTGPPFAKATAGARESRTPVDPVHFSASATTIESGVVERRISRESWRPLSFMAFANQHCQRATAWSTASPSMWFHHTWNTA
jgi:hypothetical protein